MTRILIAGGAGFIGRHLVRSHLADGHEVAVIDNGATSPGSHPPGLSAFADYSITKPGWYWQKDHRGGADDRAICALHDTTPYVTYDVIYNLASRASPRDFAEHGVEILETSSVGTLNLLGAARLAKATYVHASTSEVYGDPEQHPQPESYRGNVDPVGPRSCYDEGKRYAEALITAYARERGVDARIARIFNTYGPGMPRDGRLVPAILDAIENGERVPVHGGGMQTRSLCYVSDTVRGLRLLAGHASLAPTGVGPYVVNIGNDDEWQVREIVEAALQTAGLDPRLWMMVAPMAPHDPYRRRPDLRRARSLLDYEPSVSLAEGLRLTFVDAGVYDPPRAESAPASRAGSPVDRGRPTDR